VQVRTKGQKDEKYDPGAYGGLSCDNKNTLCERTCEFDATNEFRIYRNDYGDWISEIAVPWQFRLLSRVVEVSENKTFGTQHAANKSLTRAAEACFVTCLVRRRVL